MMDEELQQLLDRALATEILQQLETGGGPAQTTPQAQPVAPDRMAALQGFVADQPPLGAPPMQEPYQERFDLSPQPSLDDLPSGEQVADWLNRAGESMTLGLVGDEAAARFDPVLAALIPGRETGTYEENLARYRQQEEDLGTWGRLTADLTGAVVPALAGVGFASGARSLGGAIGRGALTGGTMGATHGFMEGEGGLDNRLGNAGWGGALGAVLGGAIPAIGHGVRRLGENLAVRQAARNAPTTDELRALAGQQYQAIDNAGVQIRPDVYQNALGDIRAEMLGEGVGYSGARQVMPTSTAVADTLAEAGAGANTIPWQEADMLRRFMSNAAGSNVANRGDTRVTTQALGRFDDFVQNLGIGDVDAGDIRALQTALPRARELWSRMMRSQTIDSAIEASENYLSGSSSGLRNQFARILRSPELSRGFSDIERRMLQRVVRGTPTQQLINLMGGGMGQLTTVGVGAGLGSVAGGPVGGGMGAAAGAGVAALSRRLSEGISGRNAELVRALIAAGGMAQTPQRVIDAQELAEILMATGALGGMRQSSGGAP